jgi:hypothetical protein
MLIVGKNDPLPGIAGRPDRFVLQQTSMEILGSNTRVVFVQPEQMKTADVADLRYFAFDSDGALVTAIQCESLGWHNLAQALLKYSLEKAKNPDVAKKVLARLAWDELDHKLMDRDTDWTKAAAGMRMVLAADPTLDTDDRRGLLRSLEAALVPSKAQPGSIQAMVDDLMEARSDLEDLMDLLNTRPDRSYLRVLCQGMAAAPTLLQHLDDDRLTRRSCQRPTKWQFHHDRVRDVVSDLLRDLADGELGPGTYWGWDVIRSEALDKDTAQAWWNKVRHLGEEEYLLAHALPVDAKWPNQSILRVLAAKYPRNLLKVYRTLLEKRSEVYSWQLAELIVEASLPEKDKLAVLRYTAERPNVEHRRAALKALEKLTQKK